MTDQLAEALKHWEHWNPKLPGNSEIGEAFNIVLNVAREHQGCHPTPDDVSDTEMEELAKYADDLRCHFDQKEQVHYVGLWKKVDVAPRVVLTALRVVRSAAARVKGTEE